MNMTNALRQNLRLRLDKYRVKGKKSDCYDWKGAFDTRGFPRIYFEGSSIGAHRAAWMERYGKIPGFKFIRHSCGNKSCTNPEHLITSINKTSKTKTVERKVNRPHRERLSVDLPSRHVHGIKSNARKRNITITKYMCMLIGRALEVEKSYER